MALLVIDVAGGGTPQEGIPILFVSKCFRASGARGRKRSRRIAGGQATLQIAAAQELMQKACVKTIPGSDRVYTGNRQRSTRKAFGAALRHRPLRPEFDDYNRHHG